LNATKDNDNGERGGIMSWFQRKKQQIAVQENPHPAQNKAVSLAESKASQSMLGLMQDWPLTIDKIITHAKRTHPWREVVSRGAEGDLRRSNYGQVYDQSKRVSASLLRRGIRISDRIGTLAWNTERHMEAWYGIAGIGAVYHTLNPRLFPQQLAWIANHADDRLIFADITFIPLLDAIQDHLPKVEAFILLTTTAQMPATKLRNAVSYEAFLAEGDGLPVPEWGKFDENSACGLCYTSGTTGDPKGVLYSHRSNMLLTLFAAAGFTVGTGAVILPVVPMFHANAWALNFLAPINGAKLVLPGPRLDGASLYDIIETEGVTWTAAVPTLWLSLLQYTDANNLKFSTLKNVVIGGAATPLSLARDFAIKHGVDIIPGWGMTETSPIGTLGGLVPEDEELDAEASLAARMRQGRNVFGVEMTIADADGKDLPRDGKTMGRLLVKGGTIAKAYFKSDQEILDTHGYFDTGDVATIDKWNVMQITDRAKDIIKSGGEWISSVDLENIALGHPASAACAVIGVPHPKWDERPMLIVQLKPGASATEEDYRHYLEDKVAKWWMPDEIKFVETIPLSATGKVDKKALRRLFLDQAPKQAAAE
jgi:acyl-CoA synthetase (AMP-forming)/AMP-acid ligase II